MKILLPLVFLVTACATTYNNPHLTLMSESQYYDVIDKNTQRERRYDGFHATLEASVTVHNSDVLAALLDQNARIFQWNSEQYQLERAKAEAEKGNKTEFFLSFFVPDKKYDDLHKKTTTWKVFMDMNGRRLEGRVTKLKNSYAELHALYPHFTRWNTGYRLTFPVATMDVDQQPCSITLTGPVGSVQLKFNR